MLEESNMDKKSLNRTCQPPSRFAVVDNKKSNESSHKLCPRTNKKRESSNVSKNEPFRKNVPSQTGRGQVQNRTKIRNKSHFLLGGVQIAGLDDQDLELESLLAPGGRKQNISHLLNFKMPARHTTTYHAGCMLHRQSQHRTAYHKEKDLYLRAYCQFVVKENGEFNENFFDLDTPIKWEKIEEVVVRGTGRTECPICLGPPVAGRIGHCGHVYCWACALHYADAHEKNTPPCPVCATPLHVYDMKPARMVQWNPSFTEVTMRLVRRLRGSTAVEVAPPREQPEDSSVPSPLPLELLTTAPYCKWFTATTNQINNIMSRERKEINNQILEEIDTTEVAYMEKALELLKSKEEILNHKAEYIDVSDEAEDSIDNNAEVINNNQQKIDWFDEEEGAACLESILDKTGNICLEEDQMLESEVIENSSINKSSESNDVLIADRVSLCEHEDLEKSNLTETDKEKQAKYFYFYQAEDGQPIFLHRMNVRMLSTTWGSLVAAPPILRGRLLNRETLSLDEQTKKHMPYTAHLPLHCSFDIVELELQPPYVTPAILELFSEDLKRRARLRARHQREELRRERAYSRSLEGPPRPDITSAELFPPATSASPPRNAPPLHNKGADPPQCFTPHTAFPPLSPSALLAAGPSFAQMASTSGQWRVRKTTASPPPEPDPEDTAGPKQPCLADVLLAALTKTEKSGKNKKKQKVLFSNAMPRAS